MVGSSTEHSLRPHPRWRRWLKALEEPFIVVALAALALLIFGSLAHRMITVVGSTDFMPHMEFALDMRDKHLFPAPHILYQIFILILLQLFPKIALLTAGEIVTIASYVATTLILYRMIRGEFGGRSPPLIAAALALALSLVSAINFLTGDHHYYFGYIEPNAAHSPTILLLKPFSLLLLVFAVRVLDGSMPLRARSLSFGVMLIFLSMLAKPHFALVLLPALLVIAAYRVLRGQFARLLPMLVMLVIPLTALLAFQYALLYLNIDTKNPIGFAPLAVLKIYETNTTILAFKFAFSFVFPLVVYGAYFRQAVRDVAFNLAWLMFGAGVGQMYLFYEMGNRMMHGNFWWSAQIALFVLFAVSAVFWVRQFKTRGWRGWLCLLVFAMHLYSGWTVYQVTMNIFHIRDLW